jgi:hypothetical protein
MRPTIFCSTVLFKLSAGMQWLGYTLQTLAYPALRAALANVSA